jgi:hypothetical protein
MDYTKLIIVGNLTSFTGGVTEVTNPMPKTSSSGRSYGGGGHSCACACACAGCACACADGADVLKRQMSSSASIASMVTMAVIMEHAGMTERLARGMAQGMGKLFPLIAPWIGGLGAFMTGSNTNSNVVFGALQQQTARQQSLSCSSISDQCFFSEQTREKYPFYGGFAGRVL